MTVSAGFYKKIEHWTINEQSGEIAYQPFQANGNPYKAKVVLVGAAPDPYVKVERQDLKDYIDSLVNPALFQELYQAELKNASREYKGCLNFMKWMKEHSKETVVLTNINCLYAESPQHLKQLKKQQDPSYKKGLEVFNDVINELNPCILILQGALAWKLFLEQYGEQLLEFEHKDIAVQQLEETGVVAKLPLSNGKVLDIMACRSMSYFGKDGASFGNFKHTLMEALKVYE